LRKPFCCPSSRRYGSVEGEEAGVASHHLDKEKALVARGGVAYLVDTLHYGVQRRVVAYGGVGAVQIIVDSAGQTDYGEVKFVGEYAGAGKRTVASYHHEGIDFVASDNIVGQLASFGCLEFHTTGRLEYGAALLYDIRYILGAEIHYFVGDKPAVAAIDTFYSQPAEYCRTGDGADCGIHTGGVASGSKYAYTLDFCHGRKMLASKLSDKVSKNSIN